MKSPLYSRYTRVKFKKKQSFDWSTLFIWGLLLGVFALSLMLGGIYGAYVYYSHDLPSIAPLEDYEPKAVTKIYAIDGSLISEIFEERRTPVDFKDMPKELIQAVTSIEDKHFFEHAGINPNSIIMAVVDNIRAGRVVRGASTITQQLARTLFLNREHSYSRKIREALLALKIEQAYTKNEILELYLNQYYFGFGVYGVEAAALLYFQKHAREMNIPECALLAGMIQKPNTYSPLNDLHKAKFRRDIVLREMWEDDIVSKAQYEEAFNTPIKPVLRKRNQTFAPYFAEHIRSELEKKYGSTIYEAGYRVYTTLDPQLQKFAEAALETSLVNIEKDYPRRFKPSRADYINQFLNLPPADQPTPYLQGAMICMDSKTGQVRAMVGGRDYLESNFNRATQAHRQVGSAFKPMVYAAAIDNGFTAADVMVDAPIEQVWGDKEWKPTNYDDAWHGAITLRYALKKSINVVTVKLLGELGRSLSTNETEYMMQGAQRVIEYSRRMGITSPLEPYPALALGSASIPLIEITSAYSVFANSGVRAEPMYITKITDRDGHVIERGVIQRRDVLNPQSAFIMVSMLQSVINEGTGRGVRDRGFDRPCAGKTGTTNDYSDAWFIGFTPQLIAGVWVGFDEVKTMGKGMVGGVLAQPIWTAFMKSATENLPVEDFPAPPEGINTKLICEKTGFLAGPFCDDTRNEFFINGTEPMQNCDLHLTPVATHDTENGWPIMPNKKVYNELEF